MAQVVLEGTANPALSDNDAMHDLDSYFSHAGLNAKASIRKSDGEARDDLNGWVMSLNSEASLGKRFCSKHPERCGGAAKAKAKAALDADTLAAQSHKAEAQARQQAFSVKQTKQVKLLSSDQAPTDDATRVTATSHARDNRLGDDVLDVPATKAADDGDVHVDGASVKQYMFSKDGNAAGAWLKSDSSALKQTGLKVNSLGLKKAPKLSDYVARRLPKLSAADDATLAKCNVAPPRPAYCRLVFRSWATTLE